ncbi:MAG: hypothetical protein ACD_45C00124G0006 [uncultured bacterium]|nr:MAG: hypothetical protein ACD_45C00124G0006 [uncultured bacterium]
MKRSFKAVLGVTLLEIMLVLAIAAMIIVMSIRYYQSASLNQKIAATMNNVTGIVAAVESYLAATGTLQNLNAGVIQPYLPGGVMPSSGWGGAMTIAAGGANAYTITVPSVPTLGCTQLRSLLIQNTKFAPVTCVAPSGLTILVTE